MRKYSFSQRLALLVLALAVLGAFVVISVLWIPYRCPLRWTFGISCPGCGMTRAAMALLRLDFAGAFLAHPGIYPLVCYLAAAIFLWLRGDTKTLGSFRFWMPMALILLALWLVHGGLYLNGLAPDFVEPQAIFPRVFRFLKTVLYS